LISPARQSANERLESPENRPLVVLLLDRCPGLRRQPLPAHGV
jgi:hypothetical protein